jgi:Ca2+-binding RTX toxin-like protein
VVVNGTNGNDAITVSGNAAGVTVSGLRALVAIQHQESTDQLDVNGLAGDDAIDASGLAAGAMSLALDGGAGNDTLLGGDGNDAIDGNVGNDTALLGAGDDTFIWDPGDGSDVVEGQDGADTMLFNGAGGDELVDLSANGNRLGSSALRAPSRWTPQASSGSTSTPSAAPTWSPSTT